MEKNLNQPTETIANINKLLAAMPEGDRARVLQFVEAIAQRQGKRQQRSQRRVKAIDDSWRVGS